jgi:hypothetical protein
LHGIDAQHLREVSGSLHVPAFGSLATLMPIGVSWNSVSNLARWPTSAGLCQPGGEHEMPMRDAAGMRG